MASGSAGPSKYFSGSDSDSEEQEINRKRFKNVERRETRPQKYRVEWENTFKEWLRPVKGKCTFLLFIVLGVQVDKIKLKIDSYISCSSFLDSLINRYLLLFTVFFR